MPTFRGKRVNRTNSGMTPPAGYVEYSKPATMDSQRQTDRSFDSDEARVNDRLSWAKGKVNPKEMGATIGGAMADGIKSMTYASKETLTEDSDGLLPSDHIMRAMGNELERRGAKRI